MARPGSALTALDHDDLDHDDLDHDDLDHDDLDHRAP
jgi:hypothetical protein